MHVILWVIIRPTNSFRTLSENVNRYFVSSVILFVVSCILGIFVSLAINTNSIQKLDMSAILMMAQTVLVNLFTIIVIFWTCKRLGSSSDFKKMFLVLSYCLFIITAISATFYVGIYLIESALYPEAGLALSDADSDPGPSYAIDFAGGSVTTLVLNGFTLFFVTWMIVLYAKAIKIVTGFGIKRSVAVSLLLILATYVVTIPMGIISILLQTLI